MTSETRLPVRAPGRRAHDRRPGGARSKKRAAAHPEMHDVYWMLAMPDRQSTSTLRMLGRLPAIVRFVIGLAWEAGRSQTLAVLVLETLSAVLAAGGLLTGTKALGSLLASGSELDRLTEAMPVICLTAGLLVVRQLAQFGAGWAQASLRPGVKRVAENRLYRATVHADLIAFDDPDFHDSMSRARDRGIVYVGMALDRLVELIGAAAALLGAAGVVTVLHPVLLPVLIVSVLPSAWVTLHAARVMHESVERFSAVHRRMTTLACLLADRGPAPEIRVYTAQEHLLQERARLAELVSAEEARVGKVESRGMLLGQAVSGTAIGLGYGLLCWLLYAGVMPLAAVGGAVLAMRSGQSALGRIAASLSKLFEQGLYVHDFAEFIELAQAKRRRVEGRAELSSFDGITLSSVTFRYPGKETDSVSDVSISIRSGQVIALVGENGSGKSTLAKLIAGLYVPQSGTVRWGGTDLSQVDEQSVYAHVGFIMQAPTQWPFSARTNISIGRPERIDPDGEELRAAARRSTADQVIERLENGYDTLLSKEFRGGTDLSGGEWQRISIARGFYRDAKVLICDEPSAAMDPRAEQQVFGRIHDLAAGRTTILITHRLSGVQKADQIFFMENGQVVERGTHGELMSERGRYHDLYSLQAAAFESP
ncbi:ATP-binding cassette domain-containing protein [Streptomyces sp. SID8381]|uniref:ABC transporter ATP-binding protein n=1 Tax=unclassified Streptomyces TaxID=2593676 RepID=UPI00037269D1|nr:MULTISPECIES: ABC transporter ATP-binding protein [unclassified Streptomyces]MYX29066.1 ATP-binding cassette domain-containing protein [Streptomyces sp. SID8381]